MKNSIVTMMFILVSAGVIFADIPRVISYQGVLIGADGKPVSGTKKTIIFTLKEKPGSPKNSWTETIKDVTINGGLFAVPLGINSTPKGFPSLDGEYELEVSIDSQPFRVPLYSSISALSIPNDIVTSDKIKDGEVKSKDIGANEIVKSINNIKETINLTKGNANIRISIQGNDISIESADTVTAARQLIGGIPLSSGVPIGTILPYAGTDTSWLSQEDWVLCDGRELNRTLYSKLLERIGVSWGTGNGLNTFNVPDLRGVFLRGTDITSRGSAGNDPDFDSRTYVTNGYNYQKVGSRQGDEYKRHTHDFTISTKTSSGGTTEKEVAIAGTTGTQQYIILGSITDSVGN